MPEIKDLKYIGNYVILNNDIELSFVINKNEVNNLTKMEMFLSDKKNEKLYLKKDSSYLEVLDLSKLNIIKIKNQKELRIAITDSNGDIEIIKTLKNAKFK